jgi:LemA protein
MNILYIVLGVLAVIAFWVAMAFNGFIAKRNQAKESWADIDVQLKRRYDLIPNLINTVKGYAAHEAAAFENVSNARAAAMGVGATSTPAQHAEAENMLSGALKSIFAIAEAYPDLKANQNFLQLQKELADTEDKIQAARRFYNQTVMALNTAIESFPGNIIAGAFKFVQMDLFELSEADKAAKEPVAVSF